MEEEPWHVKRRRELEAAAPIKRKKAEPFVQVPIWWVEAAAKAARSPATLVFIELLRVHWQTKRTTFSLSNSRLAKLGVTRNTKRRVLHALERRGLIAVERPPRKAPIVTLILL